MPQLANILLSPLHDRLISRFPATQRSKALLAIYLPIVVCCMRTWVPYSVRTVPGMKEAVHASVQCSLVVEYTLVCRRQYDWPVVISKQCLHNRYIRDERLLMPMPRLGHWSAGLPIRGVLCRKRAEQESRINFTARLGTGIATHSHCVILNDEPPLYCFENESSRSYGYPAVSHRST